MKNLILYVIIIFIPSTFFAQPGNVGINTNTPSAMLHVKDGSVVYEGDINLPDIPNPTPVIGTGVRMMWYPDKAAFRSGRAVDNSWNEINIGNYSFAAGYGVIASGHSATALGHNSKASGLFSFAAGENAMATDFHSFAIGRNALSSGYTSFAAGSGANADGNFSLALGVNASAYSNSSVAIGYEAVASGTYSTSVGASTIADGNFSNAFGYLALSRGTGATALGFGTQSNAFGSIATGIFNDTIVSTQQDLDSNTPLFIIGNGQNNDERSNALVVNYGGHTGIGTNFPAHRLDVKVNTPNAQISRFSSLGGYGEIIVHNATNTIDLGISTDWGYVGTKSTTDFRIRTGTFTRMVFQHNSGYVGIATTTPTNTLDVNGTASKPGGGTWIAPSDIRLKQDVTNYTEGLSSLLQIRPVSYKYNTTSGFDTDKVHIGIIAQELQQVAPYMVSTSSKEAEEGSSNYLEVDTSAMVYMLINAVKEQQTMITQLQEEIQQLKNVKN